MGSTDTGLTDFTFFHKAEDGRYITNASNWELEYFDDDAMADDPALR